MSEIQAAPDLPVEAAAASTPFFIALRAAWYTRLRDDAAIAALLGAAGNVFYRGRRTEFEAPAVTFFDFDAEPDLTVPLHETTVQVDVWHTDLDRCEQLADRIRQLFDMRRRGVNAAQPLVLDPPTVGRVQGVYLTRNEPTVVDADYARRSMDFRVLAYELT